MSTSAFKSGNVQKALGVERAVRQHKPVGAEAFLDAHLANLVLTLVLVQHLENELRNHAAAVRFHSAVVVILVQKVRHVGYVPAATPQRRHASCKGTHVGHGTVNGVCERLRRLLLQVQRVVALPIIRHADGLFNQRFQDVAVVRPLGAVVHDAGQVQVVEFVEQQLPQARHGGHVGVVRVHGQAVHEVVLDVTQRFLRHGQKHVQARGVEHAERPFHHQTSQQRRWQPVKLLTDVQQVVGAHEFLVRDQQAARLLRVLWKRRGFF